LFEARAAVETAISQAERMMVEAQGEVLEGDPATEIVRLAVTREADLIVVGSRGHGPLARAIVGSVSSTVIRDAPCPVMVVNDETAKARTEEVWA
jgi:nucleotide-binding universal stress UspA family protein